MAAFFMVCCTPAYEKILPTLVQQAQHQAAARERISVIIGDTLTRHNMATFTRHKSARAARNAALAAGKPFFDAFRGRFLYVYNWDALVTQPWYVAELHALRRRQHTDAEFARRLRACAAAYAAHRAPGRVVDLTGPMEYVLEELPSLRITAGHGVVFDGVVHDTVCSPTIEPRDWETSPEALAAWLNTGQREL